MPDFSVFLTPKDISSLTQYPAGLSKEVIRHYLGLRGNQQCGVLPCGEDFQ